MAATERDLSRVQAQVRRKHSPLRSAAEIGMAVGAVLDAKKMAKHFAPSGESSTWTQPKNDSMPKPGKDSPLSPFQVQTSA